MLWENILEFLNSGFGLFILGSITIPFILYLLSKYRDNLTEKRNRDLTTRIIIYRYEIIEEACRESTTNSLDKARNALSGENISYKPVLPNIEKNIPLSGLILQAVPKEQFQGKKLPASIYNLKDLEKILLKIWGPGMSSSGFEQRYKDNKAALDKTLEKLKEDRIAFEEFLA